ncbi:FecR protein [Dyadobacter jejuensis]|uniref:FecR protein n=1 Tax=Dyadobacter jejuensis TaxID=1082580 RepID=A0A316AB41_9BACT|nr:FecR family protein [Dyadobacter jejuensis]PWJ54074.1 FecR protein [Dyadobacter jejuensis]
MENYRNYTTEDFLQDDRFRNWVLSQGPKDDAYWLKLITMYPEKSNEIIVAKSILLGLQHSQELPEEGLKSQIWEEVQLSNEQYDLESAGHSPSPIKWWMAAAAFLLVAVGLVWSVQSFFSPALIEMEAHSQELDPAWAEETNNTSSQRNVTLQDGSTVLLEPGSVIRYTDFSNEFRKVYLDGKGYFEVTKDMKKPFMVFAGGIVVKVIGTSFHVTAAKDAPQNNVMVASGKVQVFVASDKAGKFEANPSIFLTPNQQVVFDTQTKTLTKGLVEQPIELIGAKEKLNFDFKNTSVHEILLSLENTYGVNIQYDQEVFKKCKITAPLSDLTLFRRLDLICQTVGATYEVFGTDIIISGGDCNL